jgi:hypothetical protein
MVVFLTVKEAQLLDKPAIVLLIFGDSSAKFTRFNTVLSRLKHHKNPLF